MSKSRRNYYRILFVQPEAPGEVIKASYRALMQKLRMHPDLGGDPEQAAMINQAYAELSDPARREAYDRRILPVIRRARGIPAPAAPLFQSLQSLVPGAEPPPAACVFCREPCSGKVRQDSRCARCQSPLSRPPRLAIGREPAGRRSAPRAKKTSVVSMQLALRGTVCRAVLRDLSLTGLSLVVPVALRKDQVLRVFDAGFEALVRVVNCRREGARFVIHASVLTILPIGDASVFLRTAA